MINRRVVLRGTATQLLFALFLFVVPAGSNRMTTAVAGTFHTGSSLLFGNQGYPPDRPPFR